MTSYRTFCSFSEPKNIFFGFSIHFYFRNSRTIFPLTKHSPFIRGWSFLTLQWGVVVSEGGSNYLEVSRRLFKGVLRGVEISRGFLEVS